jgi:hypothetical protein
VAPSCPTPLVKLPFVTPLDDDEEEEEDEEDEDDEDDEDDDSGIEVEKRKIRGHVYWYDAKSNKLYAVTPDDEVGDEVGILLANGNPLLLTPV